MIEVNWIKMLESSFCDNWNETAFSNYIHGKLSEIKTYSEVAKTVKILHTLFKKKKLKIGDKVSLLGKNSANWAIVYLAVISYGAVIVPILTDFHPEDIQHILHHSDSKFLFADDEVYELLEEESFKSIDLTISLDSWLLLHCKKNNIDDLFFQIQSDLNNELQKMKPENFNFDTTMNNSNLGVILYTSGTSGFSKGVMLPHNALLTNVLVGQEELKYKSRDRMLSFLPVAHAYGAAFDFLTAFCSGCHTTFLSHIPSPRILLKAFQEVKPAYIFSVPLILEKVYKKQIIPKISMFPVNILIKIPFLKSIVYKKIKNKLVQAFGGAFQQVVIGAASLNEEVEQFLMKIKFPFTVGYGMSECGPLISFSHWYEHRVQGVGRAIKYMSLKVDSKDPYTVPGEILVKGENLMLGYYKNNELSKQAIDKTGWLHTGDLGLLDKDGFVYIKGRKKDLILGPSGKNIYPEAIESRLNNLPLILESLVIEKNGSLIALVHPDIENNELLNMNQEEIEIKVQKIMEENRIQLNKSLPAYSKIKLFEIHWEAFEKTPTKKIKRFFYQMS